MKASVIVTLFLLVGIPALGQVKSSPKAQKIDTSNLNSLAAGIVKHEKSDIDKAKCLLKWIDSRLTLTETDYRRRTPGQILIRGEGNSNELAGVYTALLRAINIKYRSVIEINLYTNSVEREKISEAKIKEFGNTMSVFGLRHNDHHWIEVFDPQAKTWLPADPSLNLFGMDQWMKERIGFGPRVMGDTSTSHKMIAPFALFVLDSTGRSIVLCRSFYYLITQFNLLYDNKLQKLPAWKTWIKGIQFMQDHTRQAIEGKENLHLYSSNIASLESVYKQLKVEYLKSLKEKKK
jgi:hypothetical protein